MFFPSNFLKQMHNKNLYLYLPPSLFLFSLPFTHTVSFRLTTLLIFTLTSFYLVQKSGIYRLNCLLWLSAWLVLALLSLFSAADFNYSVNEIKTEIIYGLICFFAFYFFTQDKNRLNIFLYTISTAVIIASFWSILSYIKHGTWIQDARFGGMGGLSTIAITTLPIILYTAFISIKSSTKKPCKFILAALSIVLISGIILNGYLAWNMMFWPALTMQLIILFLLLPVPRKKLILAVFTPILALFFAYAMYSVSHQRGLMADFSFTSFYNMLNADPRMPVWGNVIEKIAESPLQGKGFGRATLGKAYPDISDNPVFSHSHNIFLDAAIQMGIPGMLVLAGIFVCLGWFFYRLRRFGDTELTILSAIGIAIIVGVVMKNIPDSFFNRHWALLFWAQMGMLMGYASTRTNAVVKATRKTHTELNNH